MEACMRVLLVVQVQDAQVQQLQQDLAQAGSTNAALQQQLQTLAATHAAQCQVHSGT